MPSPNKPTLPGSAAAAAAAPPAPPVNPVTVRLDNAQQADAAREAERNQEDKRDRRKPTLSRDVWYIAPDRRPRAAKIVRVWEDSEEPPPGAAPNGERSGYVNLVIWSEEPGDNQLARQTALVRATDGFSYMGLQVPFAREPHDIHSWRWPDLV